MSKLNVTKLGHFSGHLNSIYALERSTQEDCFYSGASDGYVVEWNYVKQGDGRLLVNVQKSVYSLLLDKVNKRLLIGTAIGNIHIIDLDSKKEVRNIEAHKAGVFDLKFMGDHLLSSGEDGFIHVWNKDSLQLIHSIHASEKSARVIALSPSNEEFAVGFSDYKIRVYDKKTFEFKKIIDAHSNSIFALAYSPDSQYIVSGGRDALLRSWQLNSHYEKELDIPAHTLHINCIAYNPVHDLFATASMDKTVKIWDAKTFELLKVIDKARNDAHLSSVNKILWVNDYEFLSCSDDRTIMMWKIMR